MSPARERPGSMGWVWPATGRPREERPAAREVGAAPRPATRGGGARPAVVCRPAARGGGARPAVACRPAVDGGRSNMG
jgi:hypothetical protein